MGDLFDTGLRPVVDAWLLAKSKEERSYGDYWSASSAGYCMRKVMFERLGVPKVESEDDARKQRVFTSGHLFHEWMQKITREAGISIAQELELQDEELMIRGHIDDLVLISREVTLSPEELGFKKTSVAIEVDHHLILYDYKTRNSRNFEYAREMSYFHKMQLGTYMYMLRKEQAKRTDNGLKLWPWSEPELTEGRILNLEKDTLRMIETQLLWNPQLESEVFDYWNTLNAYWKNKTFPKCTCDAHEGGFMAKEKWNGYFYEGEPCSIKWYEKWKKENDIQEPAHTN